MLIAFFTSLGKAPVFFSVGRTAFGDGTMLNTDLLKQYSGSIYSWEISKLLI